MPDAPTFGSYAEIPYEQMKPEHQEGSRFLVEIRGAAGGPSKIWVHNPKLVKAAALLGAHFHPCHYSLSEREREICEDCRQSDASTSCGSGSPRGRHRGDLLRA
jgi:4-carboxymuconolactone decarboxylase